VAVRYTITFTGNVQGVFFRATAHDIATSQFSGRVTGYVRNQPDDSVLCVAEGEQADIDGFVAAVQRAKRANIDGTAIERSAATGEFSSFTIRR
jgi:acylphosphatase